MKKYLEDLRQELVQRKMKSSEIDDIIRDHEEMIESALAKGVNEQDLEKQFGDPKKLADDLMGTEGKEESEKSKTDDYQSYKAFEPKGDTISVFVNLISDEISYQKSNDGKINVLYKSTKNLDDYEIDYKTNELTINAPKQTGFSFMKSSDNDMDLLIEIPESVEIVQLKHKSVSSDVKFTNLTVRSFELSSTSGDIEIESVQFGQTKWNTVSGDIEVNNSIIEQLTSSQISGDIELKQVKVTNDMKLHSVSGDVEVENLTCETCEYSSVSGDLKEIGRAHV